MIVTKELLNKIQEHCDSLLGEVSQINSKIEQERSVLNNLLIENASVRKNTQQEINLLSERKVETDRDRMKLNSEKEELMKDRNRIQEMQELFYSKESDRILTLNKLDSEIKAKSDELSTLSGSVEREVLASKQLDTLVSQISNKINELNSLNELIAVNKIKAEKILNEADSATRAQRDSIKQMDDMLRSRAEDLSRREISVKEKEANMIVIEQRYKKLYAEKGASFKV